jgi:hypothetical protein
MLHRESINFVQHRVINITAKGIFYGLQIGPVRVGRDLDAMTQAGCQIAHKTPCSVSIPISQHLSGNKFCIRVNRCPEPHVASSRILFGNFFCAGRSAGE